MTRPIILKICFFLIVFRTFGCCSEHKVDNFKERCEQISGVDLEEQYRPFWADCPTTKLKPFVTL